VCMKSFRSQKISRWKHQEQSDQPFESNSAHAREISLKFPEMELMHISSLFFALIEIRYELFIPRMIIRSRTREVPVSEIKRC